MKKLNQNTIKKTLIIFIISLAFNYSLFGQQCDSCKNEFDKLLFILKKDKITQKYLKKSWLLTTKLYSMGYTDYIDSIANNTLYCSHSLTKTFSDICIKEGGINGVNYYLKYLTLTEGSCEEERSFAFERMFVKFPEILLERIGKNEDLLGQIVWGFLNNRYYGAKNPFENDDYTAMTFHENGPQPILNEENCKAIFYEINPLLQKKYQKYKYQIDFILNSAIESMKDGNK